MKQSLSCAIGLLLLLIVAAAPFVCAVQALILIDAIPELTFNGYLLGASVIVMGCTVIYITRR